MEHDDLMTLKQSATVKLLQSPHVALILSFLHRQFKQGHRTTIPHSILSEQLDDYLERLGERHPGQYSGSAQHYLRVWCDEEHRFLRRYYESDRDDPVYELTPDTERAIRWSEELQKSDFVGTESRFLRIFDLLQDIVTYSTEDLEGRLAVLETEKARLQEQMDMIRATGKIENYSQTQIRERFLEANDVARRLLADFREVEENFRLIALQVQEKQMEVGARKGSIIGHVLDADKALKESDQGRSFYAFWEFLVSPSKQEELQRLLDTTYRLPDLREYIAEGERLRRIKHGLIEGGTKIVESNRRLGEQLRRLLDEQYIAEGRRVLELTGEIKQLAVGLADELTESRAFIWLETGPGIEMPMERPLWEDSEAILFAAPATSGANESAEAPLEALYRQFYVDPAPLRDRIATLLEERDEITLAHLVVLHPIRQGLAELLTYCAIATQDSRHHLDRSLPEIILLEPEGSTPRQVRLPQVIFRRVTERGAR